MRWVAAHAMHGASLPRHLQKLLNLDLLVPALQQRSQGRSGEVVVGVFLVSPSSSRVGLFGTMPLGFNGKSCLLGGWVGG